MSEPNATVVTLDNNMRVATGIVFDRGNWSDNELALALCGREAGYPVMLAEIANIKRNHTDDSAAINELIDDILDFLDFLSPNGYHWGWLRGRILFGSETDWERWHAHGIPERITSEQLALTTGT